MTQFTAAIQIPAALFSFRHLKKFKNEEIFLCLDIAEIDMGSILSREERSWT